MIKLKEEFNYKSLSRRLDIELINSFEEMVDLKKILQKEGALFYSHTNIFILH